MELDKAIDSLAVSQVKFNETLNALTRSVQWLSIITFTYYIITVLWIGSKFL